MLNNLPFSFSDYDRNRNGILLDIPEDADLTAVETQLHTQLRPRLLSVDLLLLRFPPWEMREPAPRLDEHEGISRISSRFPHLSVRILSSHNYQHFVGDNLSQTYNEKFAFEDNPDSFIDGLKRSEFLQMVRRSDALLAANDDYIFHLPSGEYSDYFLRAGNVQTSIHSLDTIFFWMLPHLKDIEGILVDTWSISSIALNCSRHIGRYDPSRNRNLQVEIPSSYVDRKTATREQLLELVERVSHSMSSAFLSIFSTTMTGRSIKNLLSALKVAGLPGELIKLLVLFRRGSNEIIVNGKPVAEMCSLELDDFSNVDASDRVAIEIDRTTYFPVFAREKEIRLKKRFALRNQSFFEDYGASKSIRIHANSDVGGQVFRHHGIYIDVLRMLQTDLFRKRLKAILEKLDRVPILIVVPPHNAGKELAKTVACFFKKKFGGSPRIVAHLDLGFPSSDDVDNEERQRMESIHTQLRSLEKTDTIAVIDDVVTTGARLSAYQKRLRDIAYKGEICYLVGVQRMQSPIEFRDLSSTLKQNNLGKPHKVLHVESVVLPNWDHDDCPLCVEQAFLQELLDDRPDRSSSWIQDRLSLLRRSASIGLYENVFLHIQKSSALRLTINSFFAPPNASQSVVLGSVAAAIQEMRVCEESAKRLDSRGFPVRTFLSAKDLSRYSDGVLRASILRSLTPRELRQFSSEKEKLLIEGAQAIFEAKEEDEQSTHAELALAVGLGKIPFESANQSAKRALKGLGRHDLIHIMEEGRS